MYVGAFGHGVPGLVADRDIERLIEVRQGNCERALVCVRACMCEYVSERVCACVCCLSHTHTRQHRHMLTLTHSLTHTCSHSLTCKHALWFDCLDLLSIVWTFCPQASTRCEERGLMTLMINETAVELQNALASNLGRTVPVGVCVCACVRVRACACACVVANIYHH